MFRSPWAFSSIGKVLSSSSSGSDFPGCHPAHPTPSGPSCGPSYAGPSTGSSAGFDSVVSGTSLAEISGSPGQFNDLVVDCLFLMRPLQLHFLRHFRPLQDPPDHPIPLPLQVKSLCLAWPSRDFLLKGKPFVLPPPLVSPLPRMPPFPVGAPPCLLPLHLSGLWSPQESRLHINMLELKAVFLALQGFEDRACSVLDNSTVVSYINHQEGTRSVPLCLLFLLSDA